MYRYEIRCYSPSLGDLYSEVSGWYNDLAKCSKHCIFRANGKRLRQDAEENGLYHECLITISIVSDVYTQYGFYNVVKSINDTFDPYEENSYSF